MQKPIRAVYRCFFFIVLMAMGMQAATAGTIDSLQKALTESANSETRVNLLNRLAREYRLAGDIEASMNSGNAALKLSRETGFKNGQADAYSNIAVVYRNTGDFSNAIKYQNESLKIREAAGNKQGMGDSYNNLGLVYWNTGELDKSIDYYLKALKLYNETGDKQGVTMLYQNIGNVYASQNDAGKAADYYTKGLQMARELNDKKLMADLLYNLSDVEKERGQLQDAYRKMQECLALSSESRYMAGQANAHIGLSMLFTQLFSVSDRELKLFNANMKKDVCLDSSDAHLKKALSLSDKIGDPQKAIYCQMSLGYNARLKQKSEAAIQHYATAYNMADKIGAENEKLSAMEQIASVYAGNKEYKTAYEQLSQAIDLRKTLFTSDKVRHMGKAEAGFEYEMKQLETRKEQEKKDALLNAEQNRLKTIVSLSLAFLAIVFVFVIILLNRLALTNKQARIIENQNSSLTRANDDLSHALRKLRDTQQQLIHHEKMASLGQLTAGIAHEIQNPLNFVNNFSEVSVDLMNDLKSTTDEDERQHIMKSLEANLGKIKQHGNRADSIVKNMLMHSRGHSASKEMTNVNDLAQEYFKLAYHGMRAKFKEFNSQLNENLSPGLPEISMLKQDMGRSILNIFNNAFYAVKKRAELSGGEQYKPSVSLATYMEGNFVVISIKDNGTGIPKEVREKIFNPFFTTKPSGEGTGLGLSLTYDMVVKGHNGLVEVDSKENEYTEFLIKLPVFS